MRSQTSGNRFTAEMLGMTLAHFGIAVFLFGALVTEGLSQQRELAVTPGQTVELGRYAFRFEGAERSQGPNYQADRGTVAVFENDKPLTVMHPEKRAYASGGQVMTEAAIERRLQPRPLRRARRTARRRKLGAARARQAVRALDLARCAADDARRLRGRDRPALPPRR